MTLATIDLDKISNYMTNLYKTLKTAKSKDVITNRIIDSQEILDVVGIRVDAIRSANGDLYEVRVYQATKTLANDKVGMHHFEQED